MQIQDLLFLATGAAAETVAEQAASSGFIGTLGLNWKLFLAQLVNFGIVLLILWKWMFQPVVGALERRRQKIESSVKTAEEIENRMKQFEATRLGELRKITLEAQGIIDKARKTAALSSTEILENAKAEAAKVTLEAAARIESEREKMFQELKEEMANLSVMVAEKILREKLDERKDKELITDALKNLKT